MQRVIDGSVRGVAFQIGTLGVVRRAGGVAGWRAVDDPEEARPGRPFLPEIDVTEAALVLEVVGLQEPAQGVAGGAQLLVHVADGLEVAERRRRGPERLRQYVHDE